MRHRILVNGAIVAATFFLGLSVSPAAAETGKAKTAQKVGVGNKYLPVRGLSVEEMNDASIGCQDCHTETDEPTMHATPGVVLGCANSTLR